MRSPLFIGLALGAIALLATGCGGDSGDTTGPADSAQTAPAEPSVDTDRIEDQLKGILSRSATPATPPPIPGQPPAVPATAGLKVKSVRCPTDIEPKKGQEFRCAVDASQAKGDVELIQKDEEGKLFSFKSKLEQPGVTTTTEGKLDLDAPKPKGG